MMDSSQACDALIVNEAVRLDEEQMLRRHFDDLAQRLEAQLVGFGELSLVLTELDELTVRCCKYGLCAGVLEALDEAMASNDDALGHIPTIDIDVRVDPDALEQEDSGADKLHAEVLACVGDYFALFGKAELANGQYLAALVIEPSCIAAQVGHTKVLAQQLEASCSLTNDIGHAEQHLPVALCAALRCVALVVDAAPKREGEDTTTCSSDYLRALWERLVCQCFHLLDDVLGMCGTNHSGVCGNASLELLEVWTRFLTTPAAFAIESLARRLLAPKQGIPQPLHEVNAVSVPLPNCIRTLLIHSETFCHVELERLIGLWRANVCAVLHTRIINLTSETAGSVGDASDIELPGTLLASHVEDISALACHFHYVGYCVPCVDDTSESIALEAAKQTLAADACGIVTAVAWLLVALYENPGLITADAADGPTPKSLTPGSAPPWLVEHAAGCSALATFLDHCLNFPKEEAALAAGLEKHNALLGLTPVDINGLVLKAAETPCRGFYDHISYPPWHDAVQSAGMLPLTTWDRWHRYFPWWGGRRDRSECVIPRILVAGCGSGHQVAVELRTYASCEVVALELSPHSLSRAVRKLRLVLSDDEFACVKFVVGDIMTLDADSVLVGRGFDLVICGGVLMCLNDPGKGLTRLAACMAPGGVLHLATYSRCSVESWRPPIIDYLRTSALAQHLYSANSSGEGLIRAPSQTEARAIRASVLALPHGNVVRDDLIQFREFFVYSGLLDLLFHPQETWYTLPELESGPVHAAGLRAVGLVFGDVNVDIKARQQYRKAWGNGGADGNGAKDRMINMAQWHELERNDPDLCGRMHQLLLEHADDDATIEKLVSDCDHRVKRHRLDDGTHTNSSLPQS